MGARSPLTSAVPLAPLLALVATACTGGAGGMYGEVSTGAYSVDGDQRSTFGYELGASIGIYLESDYVGAGIGWGGDIMWADYEGAGPPSEVAHDAMSGTVALGAHVLTLDAAGTIDIWLMSSFAMSSGDSVEVDVVDSNVEDPQLGGDAYSTYLGPTLKIYMGSFIWWFGVGPAYMWTENARELGQMSAWGAQFRMGVAGIPDFSKIGSFRALWQAGYDAEAGQRSLENDMRQHNRDQQQHRESQCANNPNCRLVR